MGDWGAESLDDVPSFGEPRAETPDWVRRQGSTFWRDFGALDAARGAPFARAALELELPAVDCEEAPCRLRGHSYVRFERAGDAFSLMPHCSVVAEDSALLYHASRFGPWRVTRGELGSEGPVELVGDGGARLRLRIDRWWEPSAPPLAAWSAWLYTRALVRERARSFGIELGLFRGEDCEEHASLPQVHDVCWSTSGGPLSVLMDPTVPRYLDDSVPFYLPSETEWVRRRVVSPVLAGHWQLFCGRLDGDQIRLSCDAVERRVRPFADELVANGVSLTRFFAGASLVFGGRYYPQLSLDALATVADCLGVGEALERELGRIAAEPGLDFPNRFRVDYVRGRLSGREVGVAELRAWAPGPPADADEEARLEIDAADAACVEGLTGPMSLRSAG